MPQPEETQPHPHHPHSCLLVLHSTTKVKPQLPWTPWEPLPVTAGEPGSQFQHFEPKQYQQTLIPEYAQTLHPHPCLENSICRGRARREPSKLESPAQWCPALQKGPCPHQQELTQPFLQLVQGVGLNGHHGSPGLRALLVDPVEKVASNKQSRSQHRVTALVCFCLACAQ